MTPSSTVTMCSALGTTPGWGAASVGAMALWVLGYPDQALRRSEEALTLAQELAHPFTLGLALQLCGPRPSAPPGDSPHT